MVKVFGALLLALAIAQFTLAQDRSDDRDARSKSLINIHVSRTTQVVNYRDRTSTKIDFQGTALMPRAEGKADIQARNGRIAIKAEFNNLEPATTFGSAYLTYVLWAISPEGKSSNLGEIVLDGSKAKLEVTTTLQTFAMIAVCKPNCSLNAVIACWCGKRRSRVVRNW